MEDYIDRGRESKDGTHDFLAACYPIQEWQWWWWWWPSDIQRYHPRIYCSVKPGRQLGYKLVLCIALPLLHLVYIYIYCLYIYIHLGGPSSGCTSLVCLCCWQLRRTTLPILVLNLMIGRPRAPFTYQPRLRHPVKFGFEIGITFDREPMFISMEFTYIYIHIHISRWIKYSSV